MSRFTCCLRLSVEAHNLCAFSFSYALKDLALNLASLADSFDVLAERSSADHVWCPRGTSRSKYLALSHECATLDRVKTNAGRLGLDLAGPKFMTASMMKEVAETFVAWSTLRVRGAGRRA